MLDADLSPQKNLPNHLAHQQHLLADGLNIGFIEDEDVPI